ncbi:YlxR family protein [Modestobacter versicolor]|uniref:YlxR family protein n=1 Tax=Modestobacter versicolor TaxID=429133 RepID=A0A323V3K2_9ACTN|nr:YlxR family protein [Modestobacter versicolor]PZA19345.1 YlxR family protein [Modestobacter versicolor]
MAAASVPVRTCVGCRRRAPVTELLRVVVRDGGLTPDPRRRLPGRGASLHPTAECLQAAARRRALPRALRSSTPLETGPLDDHLAQQVHGPGAPLVPGGRTTAGTPTDRHPAGSHVESRTSSDEPPVKSSR